MHTEIRVAGGDLTQGDHNVLVNASNTGAWLGSGVSGAIARACGGDAYQDYITAELHKRFGGDMEPGSVLITDGGDHPHARWVAHAAVMDYRRGQPSPARPDAERIEQCCVNTWDALEELPGPLTVAMPALGAGTGGLGVRLPTVIACRTLQSHLAGTESNIERVTFYGYALHELMVVAEVVLAAFGEAVVMDPDLRANLESLREQG